MKTHGKSNTKLYRVWNSMKQRCYNSNDKFYYCYGGRGIRMCDEWLNDFQAFYDWSIANGYKEEILPNGRNKWTIHKSNSGLFSESDTISELSRVAKEIYVANNGQDYILEEI